MSEAKKNDKVGAKECNYVTSLASLLIYTLTVTSHILSITVRLENSGFV